MTASTSFLQINNGYTILVCGFLALLIGAYLYGSSRKNRGQPKPERLTAERLAATPDGELVHAVAEAITDRMDPKRDPYRQVPLMGEAPCSFYAVWLVCMETGRSRDLRAVKAGPSGRFLEYAADGFRSVGAPGCAAAVDMILTQNPKYQKANDAFFAALEAEKPLELCVPFIRDNADKFVEADG